MSANTQKSSLTPFRRIVRTSSVALLVAVCLIVLSLSVLPTLIESWMLPQLAQQFGYADFACQIDHLGLTETSAGPLRLGPDLEPGLTIERIRLVYGPKTIAKGELDQVILSGLNISSVINKNGISFPEFARQTPPPDLDNQTAEENSPIRPRQMIPPVNKLIIKRSVLLIKTDKQEFRIPFSCTLEKATIPKSTTTRIAGTLRLNPRGTQISLKFSAELNESSWLRLELEGDKIELLNFADLWSRIPGFSLKGRIALKAAAGLNLTSLKLENFQSRIEWQQGELVYNGFRVDNSSSLAGANPNTILTLNKDEITAPWHLQLNNITLAAPFSPTITGLEISYKQKPDGNSLAGHWISKLAGYDPNSGLTLKPFLKKWQLAADFDQTGDYKISLTSPAAGEKWHLYNDTLSASGQSPEIKIAVTDQKANPKQLNWQIALKETVINNSGIRWRCPTIKTIGRTEIESADPDNSVLPVSATRGNLTCRQLIYNQTDLGQIETSFRQQEDKFKFKGCYVNKIINELKFITKGECKIKSGGSFQVNALLNIPIFKPARPIVLEKIFPAAGKSTIDGTLSAAGKLSYDADDGNKLRGELTLNLNHARFNDPEKNITCSNINCRINFPELPALYSAPDQKFTFSKLKAGNLSCKDGVFSFQIERDQTLLLEKSKIGWCGGNVETQALRIAPQLDRYQSTLYCDRLKLTELLKQLGQIEALGQGSVNGRIPITLNQGKITFNDGFLYSTPNQTGNIKLKSGNVLTAGIPTDSPQFAQLDLAREALKDYQYKWAKLKLNSQNDELILNLKFDGKPNLPLPFVYKKELGGFARISAAGPGSHFQGIRLDINLRFPLNHILQYRDFSTLTN